MLPAIYGDIYPPMLFLQYVSYYGRLMLCFDVYMHTLLESFSVRVFCWPHEITFRGVAFMVSYTLAKG